MMVSARGKKCSCVKCGKELNRYAWNGLKFICTDCVRGEWDNRKLMCEGIRVFGTEGRYKKFNVRPYHCDTDYERLTTCGGLNREDVYDICLMAFVDGDMFYKSKEQYYKEWNKTRHRGRKVFEVRWNNTVKSLFSRENIMNVLDCKPTIWGDAMEALEQRWSHTEE